MRRSTWQQLILTAVATLAFSSSALACPNCKEAVSAQPEEVAKVARGYNWSILLLLSMPAVLLGTGALLVRRAVKSGTMPEL